MNGHKLFNEVRSWLDAEKFSFSANVENTSIQLRLDLNHGLVPVRLLCEESPVILQVVCLLPVKAPRDKIFGTSLALLRLNARLRALARLGLRLCFRNRTQHILCVTLRSFIPDAQGTPRPCAGSK